MPKPTKGPRLGGSPAHEKLMLSGLAASLFEHGSITTTVTKARRLRPYAERLITYGKKGTLHHRRAGARQHIGEVRIVVDPAYRNRGVGRGLLHKLIELAGDQHQGVHFGLARLTASGFACVQ